MRWCCSFEAELYWLPVGSLVQFTISPRLRHGRKMKSSACFSRLNQRGIQLTGLLSVLLHEAGMTLCRFVWPSTKCCYILKKQTKNPPPASDQIFGPVCFLVIRSQISLHSQRISLKLKQIIGLFRFLYSGLKCLMAVCEFLIRLLYSCRKLVFMDY